MIIPIIIFQKRQKWEEMGLTGAGLCIGLGNRKEGPVDAFEVFAIDAGAEHMESLHESHIVGRFLLATEFSHRHRIFHMG